MSAGTSSFSNVFNEYLEPLAFHDPCWDKGYHKNLKIFRKQAPLKIRPEAPENRPQVQVYLQMDYEMLHIFYFCRRVNREACSVTPRPGFPWMTRSWKMRPVEVLTHWARVRCFPPKLCLASREEKSFRNKKLSLTLCFKNVSTFVYHGNRKRSPLILTMFINILYLAYNVWLCVWITTATSMKAQLKGHMRESQVW